MEKKCLICNAELSELEELDRLTHINNCLDQEIDKALETVDNCHPSPRIPPEITQSQETRDFDTTGMPDYDGMTTADLKKALDDYGMKKTLEVKFARVLLKQTWLYSRYGVFPECLSKYV
jgi:hypothetical protein